MLAIFSIHRTATAIHRGRLDLGASAKRKGGNREPREIPMVQMLHDILSNRKSQQNNSMPWVFWHRYWSRTQNKWLQGPYADRKKIMKSLCHKAGVKYFRYHALRHLTASILDGKFKLISEGVLSV